MRILVYVTTLIIIVFLGYALRNMIDAGYWWLMPGVFVAIFAFGYWVGDEDDRQGFRDALAKLRWFRRR